MYREIVLPIASVVPKILGVLSLTIEEPKTIGASGMGETIGIIGSRINPT